jgi:sugar phosphate isomerase/epimerase
MDRRRFILAAAALAAACTREGPAGNGASGAAAGSDAGPRSDGEGWSPHPAGGRPLGLQLYTVRDLMAEDVAATLALVAEVGYLEVEFAGYFDRAPAEIRRLLDDAGLAAPSSHIGYDQFATGVDAVIEQAKAVGHEFVIVPWIDEQQRTLDDWRRHAENFNRWGEACAQAGLKFGYHNHEFEFVETEGRIPYDLLLEETEPELVAMELDLAWARAGNADPVACFERWPGRFPLCHIKDYGGGAEVDIGEGDVDFARIFASRKTAGLVHGFVERDHPDDARASIRRNFEAIAPLWNEHL